MPDEMISIASVKKDASKFVLKGTSNTFDDSDDSDSNNLSYQYAEDPLEDLIKKIDVLFEQSPDSKPIEIIENSATAPVIKKQPKTIKSKEIKPITKECKNSTKKLKPPIDEKRKEFLLSITPIGFNFTPVAEDPFSFYRCLALKIHGNEEVYQEVRNKTINYMRKNYSIFTSLDKSKLDAQLNTISENIVTKESIALIATSITQKINLTVFDKELCRYYCIHQNEKYKTDLYLMVVEKTYFHVMDKYSDTVLKDVIFLHNPHFAPKMKKNAPMELLEPYGNADNYSNESKRESISISSTKSPSSIETNSTVESTIVDFDQNIVIKPHSKSYKRRQKLYEKKHNLHNQVGYTAPGVSITETSAVNDSSKTRANIFTQPAHKNRENSEIGTVVKSVENRQNISDDITNENCKSSSLKQSEKISNKKKRKKKQNKQTVKSSQATLPCQKDGMQNQKTDPGNISSQQESVTSQELEYPTINTIGLEGSEEDDVHFEMFASDTLTKLPTPCEIQTINDRSHQQENSTKNPTYRDRRNNKNRYNYKRYNNNNYSKNDNDKTGYNTNYKNETYENYSYPEYDINNYIDEYQPPQSHRYQHMGFRFINDIFPEAIFFDPVKQEYVTCYDPHYQTIESDFDPRSIFYHNVRVDYELYHSQEIEPVIPMQTPFQAFQDVYDEEICPPLVEVKGPRRYSCDESRTDRLKMYQSNIVNETRRIEIPTNELIQQFRYHDRDNEDAPRDVNIHKHMMSINHPKYKPNSR